LACASSLGTRLLAGNVLLSDLLGGTLLSGLLIGFRTLHGRRLGVHRDSLLCNLHPGFVLRYRPAGLGIGDGFDAVGLFALLGLGLLECPSAVNESLPVTAPAISFACPSPSRSNPSGLVGLAVLSHLSLLLKSIDNSKSELSDGFGQHPGGLRRPGPMVIRRAERWDRVPRWPL
jgi:hypothetical protein